MSYEKDILTKDEQIAELEQKIRTIKDVCEIALDCLNLALIHMYLPWYGTEHQEAMSKQFVQARANIDKMRAVVEKT